MFSRILRWQNKDNEVVHVTLKVQGHDESQELSNEVHSSIKRSAQEDPTNPSSKSSQI